MSTFEIVDVRKYLLITLLVVVLPARADWYTDRQNKMGTRVEVQFWHDDPDQASVLLERAMARFEQIEDVMSTYRPDSEISQVNRLAFERPVTVSDDLFHVIERSLEFSVLTGGAFDITYEAVGQLYDYRERVRPDAETIDARLAAIDYRLVQLNTNDRSVAFSHKGVSINLGGIAKGHAVDAVIALLQEAGVEHAIAMAGGDTRLLGDRRGRPWLVGIRDPDEGGDWLTRLALIDEAISTSGDYERFFFEDDVRYHHIINPATGQSSALVRSATVVGPDAIATDALSTSVFILGPDEGMKLIDSLERYEAVIVDPDHRVLYSRGLQPK